MSKKCHLCINCDRMIEENILANVDFLLERVKQPGWRQTESICCLDFLGGKERGCRHAPSGPATAPLSSMNLGTEKDSYKPLSVGIALFFLNRG